MPAPSTDTSAPDANCEGAPAKLLAQMKLPAEESLRTKGSDAPNAVTVCVAGPGSRSVLFLTAPVIWRSPEEPTAMSPTWVEPEAPPMLLPQTKLPDESSFDMKLAVYPQELKSWLPGPGSVSIEPS